MTDKEKHSKSAGLEGSRTAIASEFGFVDIVEGTAVWPIDFKNGEAPAFVVPSSQRCRAWFKENGAVEVIVPGVGPCPARIEGGIFEVSRDLEDQNWQASSTLRSLNVPFTSIGSSPSVVNLLGLIGRNLRSLILTSRIISHKIDLSGLSAACPNIQRVIVPHNIRNTR